jgi:hypothetical protein
MLAEKCPGAAGAFEMIGIRSPRNEESPEPLGNFVPRAAPVARSADPSETCPVHFS